MLQASCVFQAVRIFGGFRTQTDELEEDEISCVGKD